MTATPTLPPQPMSSARNSRFDNDWDMYSRHMMGDHVPAAPRQKPGNSGKRWTDEETNRLSDLYLGNNPIAAIARELGRGQNAVRIKLQQIGLLEEGDIF
jgi:hypothetical protein